MLVKASQPSSQPRILSIARRQPGLRSGLIPLRLAGWVFLFSILTACQAASTFLTASDLTADTHLSPPAASIPPPQAAFLSHPQPANHEPASPALVTPDTQPPSANLSEEVQPLPDPLRFTFPSSANAALSAWRPALYPTPWAPTPYDHFYFSRPIAADQSNWLVTDYRYGGIFFEDIIHTGVDIQSPRDTPVLAAGSGKVIWAGFGVLQGYKDPTDPYGLAVLIRHDFGYQGKRLYTLYGHLNSLSVVKGQHVEAEDILGLSGETGKVTGPHLHFEVRWEDGELYTTLNPELWLVPPQGWGVLAGRVMNSSGTLVKSQLVIVRSDQGGLAWRATTYAGLAVSSDPYYQENLVISDLPAGRYEVQINYLGRNYSTQVEMLPGLVSYFTFQGRSGFGVQLPPTPSAEFTLP